MDVKGGGAATAPGGEENIRRPGLRVRHDTGGFTGWSQGRRLGGGLPFTQARPHFRYEYHYCIALGSAYADQ